MQKEDLTESKQDKREQRPAPTDQQTFRHRVVRSVSPARNLAGGSGFFLCLPGADLEVEIFLQVGPRQRVQSP